MSSEDELLELNWTSINSSGFQSQTATVNKGARAYIHLMVLQAGDVFLAPSFQVQETKHTKQYVP